MLVTVSFLFLQSSITNLRKRQSVQAEQMFTLELEALYKHLNGRVKKENLAIISKGTRNISNVRFIHLRWNVLNVSSYLIPQLIFQTFPRGPDLKKRGQYRDARKAKTNVSFTSSRKRTQFLPQFSFSTKPSRSSKTNLSSSLAPTNFSLRESEEFIRWVKSESSVLKVFLD